MKIRIGKELHIFWSILTQGENKPLEGRDLRLYLQDPNHRRRSLEFTTDANTILVVIPANALTRIGRYALILTENEGHEGQTAVDANPAFTLVESTKEEDITTTEAPNLEVATINLATGTLTLRMVLQELFDGKDGGDMKTGDILPVLRDGELHRVSAKIGAGSGTGADYSAEIEALTAKVEENAANIAGATSAVSNALEAAQAAQDAATTASENAAQANELASEAKTIVEQIQGTADDALSEATEARSEAANATTAANNAKSVANAAQEENSSQNVRMDSIEGRVNNNQERISAVENKNTEQDTRLNNIESRIDTDIAGATSAASEALTAAQKAQAAASSASENAGQALGLSNEAKGIAERIEGKADDALNKATEAAGKAEAAKTAATEAKTAADAAKKENETQNTRIESIAGKADTATRMLRFSSIIFDASIEEQEGAHISHNFQIVFVRSKGLFVASDGGKYYKVFSDSDDYNTTLEGVTKARQDRLFFVQSLEENRYYHYDGVDLRHLTTSGPEIAGRVWNEDNATPKAESYYGSLKALRDLPKRLGLGRYLVTDNRERKKLDPNDSTKYLDGSPAKLDGSEGQCMWCWNGFYANIWHEGSRLIKAVTFDGPVGGETSVWIPAGGISWLGAGVMDRKENKLCSIISDPELYGPEFDAERYRGGGGVALNPSTYSKAPAADSPQITMLGMPATKISANDFGAYARKRGEGWEANWFVARFVVEFLFEVIMGTENSQEAFSEVRDANGLFQGGFGVGVTNMNYWYDYNALCPLIPTSVGLKVGDGVCLVPYSLPNTGGAEGAYQIFNVPVFFGLVGAGYGHLYQWVRGLIMNAGDTSKVYVARSMYDDYNPDTVSDKDNSGKDKKILVAECPQEVGWIKRKSYQGLCCMPTEVGGNATTRNSDYFHTNAATSKGLRVRAAGGNSNDFMNSGASRTIASNVYTDANLYSSAPLCYFEEDPIIPESEELKQE